MRELRELIATCDFEAATKQAHNQITITDLPGCEIWVREGDVTRHFTAPILSEDRGRAHCARIGVALGTELVAAWRLWRALEEASPYNSEALYSGPPL